MPSWALASRVAGKAGAALEALSSIFLRADDAGRVVLLASDIRTSITLVAEGVTVLEGGTALIPSVRVGELLSKLDGDTFELDISQTAVLRAGRNRYSFAVRDPETYPVFPKGGGDERVCVVRSTALAAAIKQGSICADISVNFPLYIGAVFVGFDGITLSVASTDKRRMAVRRIVTERSRDFVAGEGEFAVLMPVRAALTLVQILDALKETVDVFIGVQGALAFFMMPGITYGIRLLESKFPDFEKHIASLNESACTTSVIGKAELVAALERMDIVVRDTNRAVMCKFEPGGELVMTGKSAAFGEAVEEVAAEISGGEVALAFNTRYLMDAVRAADSDNVIFVVKSPDVKSTLACITNNDGKKDFMAMFAPIELSPGEVSATDNETKSDKA
jgi:DNA polymerase-3 subunit beta